MNAPARSVLICMNQRSGSTMLSRALRDTGVVGTPEEYFLSVDRRRYPDMGTWEAGPHGQPGMSRAEYLESVYARGTTPNGVFSAKMSWICMEWMLPEFRTLAAFESLDDRDVIARALPHLQVVFLTRRNRVAQAVSWARADQEGVWVISDSEPPSPTGTPEYDGKLIGNLVRLIEHGEAQWQRWFREMGLSQVHVQYEDIVDNLGAEISLIVNELRLGPIDASHIAPATRQQADAINQEWIERFRHTPSQDPPADGS